MTYIYIAVITINNIVETISYHDPDSPVPWRLSREECAHALLTYNRKSFLKGKHGTITSVLPVRNIAQNQPSYSNMKLIYSEILL